MVSPYDPEAVAQAMAGGVASTLAGLREEVRLNRSAAEKHYALAERLRDENDRLRSERDAMVEEANRHRDTKAEVLRLREEFRRIEECVAALVAGERCYAQVMKLLHEAPRPEVKP